MLDVVTYIQRHVNRTLSYRVGMRGSCAKTVNGVARWTCRTNVAKVASNWRLEIAPLSNLPVIKDLTTDYPCYAFEQPLVRLAKGLALCRKPHCSASQASAWISRFAPGPSGKGEFI